MTIFKTIMMMIVAFTLSSKSFASYEDYTQTISITNARATSQVSKSSGVTLILPSFVIHGFKPSQNLASEMPQKMDPTGTSVFTPGIGLEYKGAGGLMLLGAFVKDCYDDPAGTLQIGNYYRITKDTDWAWSLGVYTRQTPYTCDVTKNGKNCYVADSFDFKWMTKINGYDVDIIPLPFLHLTSRIYKDKDFEIKFKFMGNFLLNEFGIEIPI